LESRNNSPGGRLKEMVAVARNCYRLIIEYPWLAPPQPGQFVQLRWHRGTDPLLRRPFSIHRADCRRGELWLLIQVAGRGTADLVERGTPGMELDILGPLGRSFPHLEEEGLALLLGGGVGLAPLLFLAEERRRRGLPFRWLIGGAGADLLPPPEYFLSLGLSPQFVTEDGSLGEKGLATDLLQRFLEEERPSRVHACGPVPMLATAAKLCRQFRVPCHLSLESFMACGVGACQGCVVPIRHGEKVEYRRVCLEGPVFDGEVVDFEQWPGIDP